MTAVSTGSPDATPESAPTPDATDWVLFGATGVTGRMVLERALAVGRPPRVAGRPSERLSRLASAHGLESVAAPLDDPAALATALSDTRLVLNAAGPFGVTAPPLIDAALAAGVDYLDLNGELAGMNDLLAQHDRAAAAGAALVAGCGFGVAASDGVAAQVSTRLGGAQWLRITVAADSAYSSPAVAESTLNVLAGGGWEVDDATLRPRRIGRVRWQQRLGDDSQSIASTPLADLTAALHATGVPRIIAGVPMARAQAATLWAIAPLMPSLLKCKPVRAAMARTGGHDGDSMDSRHHVSRVVVEGGRADQRLTAVLEMGEGFAAAADIAVAAIEAALTRRPPAGTHTPATAFGSGFIASVPGVTITYL